MKFTVVTLFPDLIEGFVTSGLLGQAFKRGEIQIATLNPRIFTQDAHHTVDDKAFGGGDGMVMKIEPLYEAVSSLRASEPCRVVVMGPQGRRWTQQLAHEFSESRERIVLICGRYAGIDNRFTTGFADDEISIGDFILNGGEVAALAMIESCARLKPGVLGNQASAINDSFEAGLLECPQFTRPREFMGMSVPAPLLTGHHENVRRFERAVSLVRTKILRPDILQDESLVNAAAREVLALSDSELKVLGLAREAVKGLV